MDRPYRLLPKPRRKIYIIFIFLKAPYFFFKLSFDGIKKIFFFTLEFEGKNYKQKMLYQQNA